MSLSAEGRCRDLELAVSVLCQIVRNLPGQSANPAEVEVLRIIEQITRRPIDRERLEEIARELGPDVLFVDT